MRSYKTQVHREPTRSHRRAGQPTGPGTTGHSPGPEPVSGGKSAFSLTSSLCHEVTFKLQETFKESLKSSLTVTKPPRCCLQPMSTLRLKGTWSQGAPRKSPHSEIPQRASRIPRVPFPPQSGTREPREHFPQPSAMPEARSPGINEN